MKLILIYIITMLISSPGLAQNEIVKKYAASITQDDLKKLLTIIASDALEGRETGTHGQKMVAAFIVEEFNKIGLTPVVPTAEGIRNLQKFTLENYNVDGIYLKTDNMYFNLNNNILFSGRWAMQAAESDELVLLVNDEVPSRINLKQKVHLIIAIGSNVKNMLC